MERIKKGKSQKGMSIVDIVIAIMLLLVFVGVIASYYTQTISNTVQAQLRAMASNYAIQILERTDKLAYEEVTNGLNNTIKQNLPMGEGYIPEIQVISCKEEDPQKRDILKIVTATVKYQYQGKEQSVSIQKLKRKE